MNLLKSMKFWSLTIAIAFLLTSVPYPAYGMKMLSGASRNPDGVGMGPEDAPFESHVKRAYRATKGIELANKYSGTTGMPQFRTRIDSAFGGSEERMGEVEDQIVGGVAPGFREILIKELLSQTKEDTERVRVSTSILLNVINSGGRPAENTLEILLGLEDKIRKRNRDLADGIADFGNQLKKKEEQIEATIKHLQDRGVFSRFLRPGFYQAESSKTVMAIAEAKSGLAGDLSIGKKKIREGIEEDLQKQASEKREIFEQIEKWRAERKENTKIFNSARSVFAELAPEILAGETASEKIKGMVVEYYQPLVGASAEDFHSMFISDAESIHAPYHRFVDATSLFDEEGKPILGIKEALLGIKEGLFATGNFLNFVVPYEDRELRQKIRNVLGLKEGDPSVGVIGPDDAEERIAKYLDLGFPPSQFSAVINLAYRKKNKDIKKWEKRLEESDSSQITKIPAVKESENKLRLVLFAVVDGFAPEVSDEYERYLGMFLANNRIKNPEQILAKVRKKEFDWTAETTTEDLESYQRVEKAYQEGETVVTI